MNIYKDIVEKRAKISVIGKITGIKYKVSLAETLKKVDINGFNINECPAYCLVRDNNNSFAVSKWVSPKAVLNLTSKKIIGEINEKDFGRERAEFIFANNLDGNKQLLISELFKEAVGNGFGVRISNLK